MIIGEGISSIGKGAFGEGIKVKKLYISGDVKNIGQRSFVYDFIEYLELGEGIETIGEGAFQDNNLTNISIPNSVTTIGEYICGENGPNKDSNTMNCSGTDCAGTWNLVGTDWVKE